MRLIWDAFKIYVFYRYNVADSPIAFDSDYMVFVSPPPQEKSKAVAPYMPFNAFVKNLNNKITDIFLIIRCGALLSGQFLYLQ